MRLRWLGSAAALMLLALGVARAVETATPVQAEGPDIREGATPWIKAGTEPVFAADEIVVRFESGIPPQAIEAINRSHGAATLRVGTRSGLHRLKLPPGRDLDAVIESYERRPEVVEAARNPIARVFGGPNDPLACLQWHLDHHWSDPPPPPCKSAPAAWNGINWHSVWESGATGGGITVAVIDTGVAYDNDNATDLKGPTCTVLAAGCAFLILPGSNVKYPATPNEPRDDHGHGTHVTGTIAQRTNNWDGVAGSSVGGVAGVASGATIVPIKVLDNTGSGDLVDVLEGIYLAIGATAPPCVYDVNKPPPAQVINMSLGWPAGTTLTQLPGLADALDCAQKRDVVVVAASGNDGEWVVSYPAAYPTVIAVGASGIDEYVTWYSNAGDALDITAPGGEDCSGGWWIYCWMGPSGDFNPDKNGDGNVDGVLQQTFALGSNPNDPRNWRYYFLQGTSMASPHVAGVAALLRARNPSLKASDVRGILQSTAEDHGDPGWDSLYGWGIVNAYAALQQAGSPPPPPPDSTTCTAPTLTGTDSKPSGGGTITLSWTGGPTGATYRLQRRNVGSTSWSNVTTTGSLTWSGTETREREYHVRVQTGSCTPIPGPYSPPFDPDTP